MQGLRRGLLLRLRINSLRDNYIATQITKNSDGDVTKIVLKRK